MPAPGRGGGNLRRKDSCDSGVSVSPLGSLCNSPPGSRKDTASIPPSSFTSSTSSSLTSSTSSSAGSSSTSLHPPPSTPHSLLRASSLPPSLPLSTPSTRASSLPPSTTTPLPYSSPSISDSSLASPATSSSQSTPSTRATSLPPSSSSSPPTSCLPVITIEREEEEGSLTTERPQLPSEPSAGQDVFLPSAGQDLLSEELAKEDRSSDVDSKVDLQKFSSLEASSSNTLQGATPFGNVSHLKRELLFEKASLKKSSETVENPGENRLENPKSKISTLRATLSSPALPLYGQSAGSNGSQKPLFGCSAGKWTSPMRSAPGPGWESLRPSSSPGSEQRRSLLASMICDQEKTENGDISKEAQKVEQQIGDGKEKDKGQWKGEGKKVNEENDVEAEEIMSSSLSCLSSASESKSSKSPFSGARAFLSPLSSTSSTKATSLKQSPSSTFTKCAVAQNNIFKRTPSPEESIKTQSSNISPSIVSEMALSKKENIVPSSKSLESPSAPRQSRSIAELSEALKLSLAPSSKPSNNVKSRRYSAPPTNYSNLPSSPLSTVSSPQTAQSPSLLRPSGQHLSESAQQFCFKPSPLSPSSTDEHLQPSSLGSSSLKASSLQPSSLQMLRKSDDQLSSKFSSKNTSSLQPSSRFVSKTTISLGDGEVAPSPPILYSPNNSVTCGVRPSPGGVRVAVAVVPSEGVDVAGAPRFGPRPWSSKGEVHLVENTASVSRIKISPSSTSSPNHSSPTAARVNIGSFALRSSSKDDAPLLSLPSLQPETKAEALGFSF